MFLLIVDLSAYVIYLSPVAFPFRLAPYIRVVFFILNIRYGSIHFAVTVLSLVSIVLYDFLISCLDGWTVEICYILMFLATNGKEQLYLSIQTTMYIEISLFYTCTALAQFSCLIDATYFLIYFSFTTFDQ